MDALQLSRPFKPRRAHKKSRNGCKYCRRRRIKCDETKPSCLRCLHRRQPCEYFTHIHEYEVHPETEPEAGQILSSEPFEEVFNLSLITPPQSVSSIDHTPTFFDASPSAVSSNEMYGDLPDGPPARQPPTSACDITLAIQKDLYLFDHYMHHTCRDVEVLPNVAFAKKIGIPQLAAENPGILCSIMAFGAACLSIDLLTGQSSCSQIEDVSELISAGDRYHRIGMQSLRHQMMTASQPRQHAEAHAHAVLLFPYALARRRISYLLNDAGPSTPTSGVDTQAEHLTSVEWMILLRGVTTTGRACWSESSVYMDDSPIVDRPEKTHPLVSAHVLAKLSDPDNHPSVGKILQCRIASKHPLFPVVASTRLVAVEALQQKYERVNQLMRNHHRNDPPLEIEQSSLQLARSVSLSACLMAIDLLINLNSTIFNPGSTVEQKWSDIPASAGPSLENPPLPWLRRYTSPPIYDPALPAIRTVFAWVNRTAEEYFQLLLKPMPVRSDSHGETYGHSASPNVDREIQLLAWDIWAHWMVLTILIEGESIFTPCLGVSGITNLSPWFRNSAGESPGSNAHSRLAQGQDWWPWSMCSVAHQLRRYDGEGLTT